MEEAILRPHLLHGGLTLHVDHADCYLFPTFTHLHHLSSLPRLSSILSLTFENYIWNHSGVSECFESILLSNLIQQNIC